MGLNGCLGLLAQQITSCYFRKCALKDGQSVTCPCRGRGPLNPAAGEACLPHRHWPPLQPYGRGICSSLLRWRVNGSFPPPPQVASDKRYFGRRADSKDRGINGIDGSDDRRWCGRTHPAGKLVAEEGGSPITPRRHLCRSAFTSSDVTWHPSP
jgi:hypothetical protein